MVLVVLVVIVLVAAGGYFFYQNYSVANMSGDASNNAATSDVVQAQDVTVGTGALAGPGSVVSILYVGRLADGTVFDSSEAHDNQPLVFQLGTPGIIPGFQIGVNGMREGGERRMVIPSSLGYGGQDVKNPDGAVIVPANSTLTFDVKLLTVTAAPEDKAPKTDTQ